MFHLRWLWPKTEMTSCRLQSKYCKSNYYRQPVNNGDSFMFFSRDIRMDFTLVNSMFQNREQMNKCNILQQKGICVCMRTRERVGVCACVWTVSHSIWPQLILFLTCNGSQFTQWLEKKNKNRKKKNRSTCSHLLERFMSTIFRIKFKAKHKMTDVCKYN